MLKRLEDNFGFKIKTIQTDNGREFCNDREQKKSLFERVIESLGMEYIRTGPYSPWQSEVVERSYKIDFIAEGDLRVKQKCTKHLKDTVQEQII